MPCLLSTRTVCRYNHIDIVGALSCNHFVHSVPYVLYLVASLDATFATVNTLSVRYWKLSSTAIKARLYSVSFLL